MGSTLEDYRRFEDQLDAIARSLAPPEYRVARVLPVIASILNELLFTLRSADGHRENPHRQQRV